MTERDTQLANLIRELHLTSKLSPPSLPSSLPPSLPGQAHLLPPPAQMRHHTRAGFLDSNDQSYTPVKTI